MKLLLALLLSLAAVAQAAAQSAVVVPATMATASIVGTVATSTKIISGIAGKTTYITALNLVPVATSAVTLTAGTGTNCGTGSVNLTGTMTFAAGQALHLGNGYGAVLVPPQGDDVCITIGTAVAPGSIGYAQF